MCGFYGLFTGKPLTGEELKDQRKYSQLIKYRGPDFSGEYISNKKDISLKAIMIMDFLSLIILNYFLTPVLAFTLYFCFLHSVRHSISLIFELDKYFKIGFQKFISKAIPLTLATSIMFLIAIYFLDNFYRLDEAIYKVIFIGLASLTFPHILLEYLLEKNEKRT